jgi:hypothetical protein
MQSNVPDTDTVMLRNGRNDSAAAVVSKKTKIKESSTDNDTNSTLLLFLIPVVLTETKSGLSYTEFRLSYIKLAFWAIWVILPFRPTVLSVAANIIVF